MAYTKEQVRAQIDARKTKRHMDNLALACLEMGIDFSVQHQGSIIIIRDLGTDRSCYIKAVPDDGTPYMQSGRMLALDDVKSMIAAFVPTARVLQPAYAMNYIEDQNG